MRIILNTALEPHFNLAAEEFLLENCKEDVFMLWRNSASVIIGKNQNVWAEVNTDLAEARGIPVVRRLTGGGAVFHDPGNVNFTFITGADEGTGIDFSRFTAPMILALSELGIEASADGRNDIISSGFKISGNAQCRYRCKDTRQRIMHHGTLLYDADISGMAPLLRVDPEKLRSKGVRSVPSRVKNIRTIGDLSMDVAEFTEHLLHFAEAEYGCAHDTLSKDEILGISTLANEKYSTWDWNFGKSPEYEESRTKRFPWGSVTVSYTLSRGIVSAVHITGDFFGAEDTDVLTKTLTGLRFERDEIKNALSKISVGDFMAGASDDDLILLLFGGAV